MRLALAAPDLLVTGGDGETLWDPAAPRHTRAVRTVLEHAAAVAVAAVRADLEVIDHHTRTFLNAVVDPATLSAPQPNAFQNGYAYLHTDRRLIAYNLEEPGMERLKGPALPFEREMLGCTHGA